MAWVSVWFVVVGVAMLIRVIHLHFYQDESRAWMEIIPILAVLQLIAVRVCVFYCILMALLFAMLWDFSSFMIQPSVMKTWD